MTASNQAIAFSKLLKDEAKNISIEDWQSLLELSDQLPEEDEKITEVIEDWLESRPSLLQVYKQNLQK